MIRSLLFFLLATYAFACSGNCISCHPSLEKSINEKHHEILKSCISCHTTLPQGMSECGGDCFDCHSQNKLIKSKRVEHQALKACKECHINKEDILNYPSINNSDNLLDLLNNK